MTALDAALAEVLTPLVDAAVKRVRTDLETSMRHVAPLAVPAPAAGELLGCSERTVRRLVADGHLPRLPHVGDRLLIPVAALEAFTRAAATPAAREHAPPGAA